MERERSIVVLRCDARSAKSERMRKIAKQSITSVYSELQEFLAIAAVDFFSKGLGEIARW